MATIAPAVSWGGSKRDGSTYIVTWTPVTSADTCGAWSAPEYADRSVHVSGTFNSASCAVHGSNNAGASFAALNDPTSTVIAITAEGIKAILENTDQIKPVITGGGGSQSLTVSMLFHLSNPLRQ